MIQIEPDIALLDVQMPELDGLGVLSALPGERMPAVIFVTAYNEYAVKAFEVHALDYVLKPVSRERLTLALARAKRQRARERAIAGRRRDQTTRARDRLYRRARRAS